MPYISSTYRQTNEGNLGNVSEDFLELSRIELPHLLLDAHLVHDEEDASISSILHNRFPYSTSVQILFPIRTALGEEPASSLLCGSALAFDRHAKSFASNFNAYSSS